MSRRGWVLTAVAMVAVVVLGGGAVVAAVQVNAAPPAPVVQVEVPPSFVPVAGPPPPVHLPPQGSLALQGLGADLALLHADQVRPIASVAKTLTAYQVLRVHPLGDQLDEGPTLTLSDVDVQDWHDWVARDGSTLPVAAGERLTEKRLLLGLMLPSANNFADTLGRWVSGSVAAFVADLNGAAQSLGMVHTHLADASGFSPQTVSTASDLVLLGKAVLQVPALAAIVRTAHDTLPDGTQLDNLDALLGTAPGWLGIKTGETPQAGGCLLFAVQRDVGGVAPLLLVGAVLGQTDLHAALDAARTAVDSAFAGYAVIHAADVPPVRGSVATRWGARSGVYVSPGGSVNLAVRMGTVVQLVTHVGAVGAGARANQAVGSVVGSIAGVERLHWALLLDRDLPPPSRWWMLFQN